MNEFPQLQPDVEKVPTVKELLDGEPDVVFILTGAMKDNRAEGRENPKIQRFESGSFSDVDQNSKLATGGKDRMLAAAELHHLYPETSIVTMSRTRNPELPTYAEVMKGELERKGVPSEVIIEESESVDTITSIKQAARFIEEHDWKNIVFLSSDWHLPRVKALLNHVENFADTPEETVLLTRFTDRIKSGELSIQFIGSGQVLGPVSHHYQRLFENVAVDEGIQKRVALENKAIEQIRGGTYGKYSMTKKIFPEW